MKKQKTDSIPLELPVKPACEKSCENCKSYDVFEGVKPLTSFCSRWCMYMNDVYSWKTKENYCSEFESKSV